MAVATTYDFEQTRDEIVADALANVGAIGPGEEATGEMRTHAARALNRVVKAIDPEGIHLWKVARRTTTTTDGTAFFDTLADVLSIDEPMSFVRSGQTGRTTIEAWSRDDYMRVADRTTEGVPTKFYVEKTGLTSKRVYLWPVPDATGDTIEYAAIVRSFDFDTGANTPDFPPEWTECLVCGVSAAIAPAYRQPSLATYYDSKYEALKARLLQAETEHGSVMLVPFGRGY